MADLVLIADIETDGLLPDLTTIWQISVKELGAADVESYNGKTLRAGLARLREARRVIFHNGLGYDLPAIEQIYPGEGIDWRRCVDTLVLSRLGNPERKGHRPHSLETWGERLGFPKVEHTDWTRWSLKMEHRCNTDVLITEKLYLRLLPMLEAMPRAVEIEHAVAHEVQKMSRRGFGLDEKYTHELLSELLAENEARRRELEETFPPIFVSSQPAAPTKTLKVVNKRHALHGVLSPGSSYCPVEIQEFNPASRIQIGERLMRRHGWTPRQYSPTGRPEISETILRDLPYPEAKALADFLDTEKKISQISAEPRANGTGGGWLHHVKDGRVYASINPCKAVTGRPSCSGPNVQQVDRDKRMRRAWVPAPGMALVGMDAEGLELRCLAHYLQPFDGGEYGRILVEGKTEDATDVHSIAQRLLGFYARNEVKRAEYGWLYGAGDAKLGLISRQDAYKAGKEIRFDVLGITPGKRKVSNTQIGKAMRARLEEGFTGLGDLVARIKTKAYYAGKLKGLDGRTLWVRSPHSALNLLLQSAGIIVVKQVIALATDELTKKGLVEDEDFGAVMWVHDELQYETRPACADIVGQTLVDLVPEAGDRLGFRCPLTGVYKTGTSWAETH